MSTKLAEFLRAATPDEREAVAEEAGTVVNYLYQLAGAFRGRRGVNIKIGLGIEKATKRIAELNANRTPVVTIQDLAIMHEAAVFEDVSKAA